MIAGISFFVIVFGLGAALAVASIMLPSKWDGAKVLKICRDGTPILELADGSIRARRSVVVSYEVKDWKIVCSN
jgi:hypothetical protein